MEMLMILIETMYKRITHLGILSSANLGRAIHFLGIFCNSKQKKIQELSDIIKPIEAKAS